MELNEFIENLPESSFMVFFGMN
uniref:Uncharacterized protein n=1 Tax=Anguilla anguilla TaxID=7936 RepID=A0A0E9R191_ANGAN